MWWRTKQTEADFSNEIHAHLALEAERLIAEGMPPDEARAAARRAFGNVALARERFYESRRAMWLDDARRDVAYALRTLARAPGFAATAVLTMALGIGATTAIVTVLYGVLLRPLPYPDADHLVRLFERVPPRVASPVPAAAPAAPAGSAPALARPASAAPPRGAPGGPGLAAPQRIPPIDVADLDRFRAHTRTLSHVAAYLPVAVLLTGGDGTTRLSGYRVSPDLFPMLGAAPLLGRTLETADQRPGAEPVVVIGHATWLRHFGGDRGAIGRRLTLDATTYTVAGVMPEAFEFPDRGAGFWIPLASSGVAGPRRLSLVARIRPDVSLCAATTELNMLVPRLVETDHAGRGLPDVRGPDRVASSPPPCVDAFADNGAAGMAILREVRRSLRTIFAAAPADTAGGDVAARVRFEAVPLRELLVAPVRATLLIFAAAVLFVLLIACVNVASLLLARGAARHREIALRLALGAGRGRLVRQALTESVLLALLGSVAGVLLAYGGVRALQLLGTTLARRDLSPALAIPRLDEIGIDAPVLAFSFALAVGAGLLAGLLPALRQAHRRQPIDLLRAGAATAPAGFDPGSRHRMQGVLIVGEIALAMMLCLGAGLLVHSFFKLSRVDLGYDPAGVLTFRIALPLDRPDAELRALAEGLVDRIQQLPRVAAGGYAESLPMIWLGRGVSLGPTPDLARPLPPGGAPAPGASPSRSFSPAPPPSGAATARGPASVPVASVPVVRPLPEPISTPSAQIVSRHLLPALGVRVIEGRGFREDDRPGQPPVMLINQSLARTGIFGPHPIGTRIYAVGNASFDPRVLRPADPPPQPYEIVGIVQDVRQERLDEAPTPKIYVDLRQLPGPSGPPGMGLYFAVRATGDPTALAPDIRRLARELHAQTMVELVAPMTQLVSNSVARPRLYAALLGLFAGLGLLLAAVGIAGAMAFAVTQRTREIGIRMALGAARGEVMRLVLRQSLLVTVVGMVLGLAGAYALGGALDHLLFGLTPLDPATFLIVSLTFALIAALAAWIPARRATRVDPLAALRAE